MEDTLSLSLSLSIYIHIHIYIYGLLNGMTFFVSDRGFDGFFGDVFEIRWGNTTLGNPGTKWCFFPFLGKS